MARPTKLTPDVHRRIVDLVRAGNYIETAAAAAGVSSRSVRDWLSRGAEEELGIYAEFSDAIEKAYAEAEAIALAIMNKAASGGDWRAVAWRLERTRRDKFGQSVDVRVKSEAIDYVLERLRQRLSPAEYQRVLAALAEDEGEAETPGREPSVM